MESETIVKRKPGRLPALGTDPDEARERIIDAFLSRARQIGIRSVVMGELASDLHMSPSTLYRYFRSKKDLVEACAESWADDLAAATSLDEIPPNSSPTEQVSLWADSWADSVSRYSNAWWRDLRRGYPDAWATFEHAIRLQKERGAARLRPYLRNDVHAGIALAVIELIIDNIPDPDLCDKLGVTRREAIRSAIALWSRGALVEQRIPSLQVVRPEESET